MVAITKQQDRLQIKVSPRVMLGVVMAAIEVASVLFFAQRQDFWPLALGVVVLMELWLPRLFAPASREGERGLGVLGRVPAVAVGMSAAMVIALSPRLATQIGLSILYFAWRLWWRHERTGAAMSFANLLVVQVAMFEAVFLTAAVWRLPNAVILALVWLGAYLTVYAVLAGRGERSAGVMAATWALVAAEVSWVLLLWLFTYTLNGGYILMPQPALVLAALAYCFGNIYMSQRRGTLSRARLAEYLLIGLILIAVVALGTTWRGAI